MVPGIGPLLSGFILSNESYRNVVPPQIQTVVRSGRFVPEKTWKTSVK